MNGQDVYKRNEDQLAIFRRREVGLIYQFYNLIPVLNVTENITLPVLMDGRKVNQERLQEMLPDPGPAGPGEAFAQSAFRRPAAASLHWPRPDERSGGGVGRRTHRKFGLQNSQDIVDLLKYSNRRFEQTLIVITHDESIALQADRILAIEDGKITRDEVILEMNVFHKVTRQTLRKNRLRTLVTIAGVILSAAMVCAVTTIVVSFQGFYRDCEMYETGDWYGRVEDASPEVRQNPAGGQPGGPCGLSGSTWLFRK